MRAPSTGRDELLRLQRLLLPGALPAIGCTETAAAYRASNDQLSLGGDWFDLIDRPSSNSVVAIVGDVVGHGVEQISVMGQLRAASNALSHSLSEPDEILAGIDLFAVNVPGAVMTTMTVVVFDGSPSARICSAGHPPPLAIRRDGTVDIIEVGRRTPLAVGPVRNPCLGDFEVSIGDVVVLYTDGVVERRGEDIDDRIEALGRFVAERRDRPCREIAEMIVDEFGIGTDDDQAVLVLRPLHNRAETYELDSPTASDVSWS